MRLAQCEFGPIKASPDSRTVYDIPCKEIPATIQKIEDHKTELVHQSTLLEQSITKGESSLATTQDVTLELDKEAQPIGKDCENKQKSYDDALKQKILSLKNQCKNLHGEAAADCLDGIEAQAELSPSVSSARLEKENVCNLYSSALDKVNTSVLIGARLRNEVAAWKDQLQKLNVAIGKDNKKLKQLDARQDEQCK